MIDIQNKTIKTFYDMLNNPAQKNIPALAESCLANDWQSFAGESVSKNKEEFVKQVIGFGKLLPDLRWDVKEVITSGDTIIVRSEASGTPATDFMGIPHSGKSFKIMAIDIHHFKGDKLSKAYHVEDWASALRQLSSK